MSVYGNDAGSEIARRRLMNDLDSLAKDPVPFVVARPLDCNLFEWHFIVRGPPETPYEGGMYHGKLKFPLDFPFRPPAIFMFTPSGRFQPNVRLCLTISDYHPETWNPAWTISAILNGIVSFMNEESDGVGSLRMTSEARRKLAVESMSFNRKNPTFMDVFGMEMDEMLVELNAKTDDDVQKRMLEDERSSETMDHDQLFDLSDSDDAEETTSGDSL